jgi:uncharacterized membrane protein YtjA (UPF0391 family)
VRKVLAAAHGPADRKRLVEFAPSTGCPRDRVHSSNDWKLGKCTKLDKDAKWKTNWHKEAPMLYYALVFLLIALLAGALGFGFVAFAAAGIAKILFFIFLVMFLVSLLMHVSGRGSAV